MLDFAQFKALVDRVTAGLGHASSAMTNQNLGTCAAESKFGSVRRQIGGGPALGVMQMEPATFTDIWVNYLAYREVLAEAVRKFMTDPSSPPVSAELVNNDALSVAMATIEYIRNHWEPSVSITDTDSMGAQWLRCYNRGGKGTVQHFTDSWNTFVAPHLTATSVVQIDT